MSNKDVTTKMYMRNPRIFADFFNGFLYEGEQVINWNDLEEMDSSLLSKIPYSYKGDKKTIQRFRDIIKNTVIKKDKHSYYVILAIENQSDIHYAMPVRNMLYDALSYLRQVEEIASKNRAEGKCSPDEYLSGITMKDKLMPVITVTLYWGSKPWNAPESLKDMLTSVDSRIERYINDYDINLFSIIDTEQFPTYQTELRELFLFLNARNSDSKMQKLITTDDAFRHLNRETAELMKEFSNIKRLPRKNKEGEYNMCKAIEDIERKSELRGEARGEAHGVEKTRIADIKNLMKNLKLSAEQAMEAIGVPKSEYKKYMTML